MALHCLLARSLYIDWGICVTLQDPGTLLPHAPLYVGPLSFSRP